jgi:hypothetical protein
VSAKEFVRLIADYEIDSVQRKDGTTFTFGTQDALVDPVTNKAIAEEFPRVWLTGALLAVGDALKDNDYFDHAPELELVYHLRNGVAHGNRFDIRNLTRLTILPTTAMLRSTRTRFSRSHRRSIDSLSYSISWMRAMCSTFCSRSPSTWIESDTESHRNWRIIRITPSGIFQCR